MNNGKFRKDFFCFSALSQLIELQSPLWWLSISQVAVGKLQGIQIGPDYRIKGEENFFWIRPIHKVGNSHLSINVLRNHSHHIFLSVITFDCAKSSGIAPCRCLNASVHHLANVYIQLKCSKWSVCHLRLCVSSEQIAKMCDEQVCVCLLLNTNTNLYQSQELIQLESLCKQLYESTDSGERKNSESALMMFASSTDCLPKCQLLLERREVSFWVLLYVIKINLLIIRFDSLSMLNFWLQPRWPNWFPAAQMVFPSNND